MQSGYKISNVSYKDSEAEIVLIFGGFLTKGLQYISKDGRELPIPVGNNKNEGRKGKAKAAVALGASTHVRRELPSRILQESIPEPKSTLERYQRQAVAIPTAGGFYLWFCRGGGSSL